jgi:acyl-CoA hydrolase
MYHAVSPDQAVSVVKNNDKIWIHSAAAAPRLLVEALARRRDELTGVNIYQLHTEGPAPYAEPGMEKAFTVNAFFIGANVRKAIQEGRANYIPIFLSEVPLLFKRRRIQLDVALVQVSAPDKHGFCSLGTSVEATLAAIKTAHHVIAQVNPQMPRTHGDGLIHISSFDSFVESNEPVHPHAMGVPTADELRIGTYAANLIEDGATLQMGIGTIPDAVLKSLHGHKGLGIHTEMFSDGVLPLVEQGIITNEHKRIHPGKIISGFVVGSQKVYDFINDNPQVNLLAIEYVNDTRVIRKNPKVTAINSAIEVDLTGQVNADSIGTRFYSGFGGQMDFIRGASLSEGGKPIIALPSATKYGESKIVPVLKPGAGVVTTRGHVHYIITEYGVAEMYAQPMRQRIQNMIAIAHPDHREKLAEQAFEFYKIRI